MLNNPNQKNGMHPDDMRNMFLFFILAGVLYFGYSALVLEPQTEAMKAAQAQKAAQEKAITPEQIAAGKPLPRDEALAAASESRITIDNGTIFGSLSTKGARLDDIALHDYYKTLEKRENVEILSPRRAEFPRHIEHGWVSSDQTLNLPNEDTLWQIAGSTALSTDTPVTLVWNNGQGLRFERTITLDDTYMFTITQNVVNTGGREVTLYPYALISQKGIPPDYAGTWISHEGPIGFVGEELQQPDYKGLEKKNESYNAASGWLGITDKYWLTALVPEQDKDTKFRYSHKNERYQSDVLGPAITIPPGQSFETRSHAFVGAKQVLELQKYEEALDIPQFDLAVDFGWLWFMSKPFFYLLHYAGEWVGNFGVAIIILTIAIRGAVFPLTNMSYRSFAKMKKVGPQIVEMRDQYGDDKQRLQQELVGLYQKEGVNPMAGCFPILLQIPIFFALYKVLFVTIEMRHAPFFGWIEDLSVPDPTSVFNAFGLIPWDPPSFLMIGVWPCVMLLAMTIQKKLNPPPQDKLQRDIANWMPYLFAFLMSQFAAGLVIYWSFSAIIGILQQIIIMKSMNVPIHLFGETKEEEELDAAIDKGPDVHPLAEMAEDEMEEALFGEHEEPKPIKPPKPKKSKKKKR